MSESLAFERMARDWLELGPDEAPTTVVEAALLEINTTSQERGSRAPWRFPPMNRFILIAAAAVAVVSLGVGGLVLSSRPTLPDATIVPDPSPSSSPAISATPVPDPSAPALPDGDLAPGTYSTQPFTITDPELTLTLTVPAGWASFAGTALLGPHSTGAPNGNGLAFLDPSGLYRDGCHWAAAAIGDASGLVEVGPSIQDLATALAQHGAYQTTEPAGDPFGTYPALRMDVVLPTDVDLASCDSGEFHVFKSTNFHLYAQGPGQVFHLWIVDANGTRFVIVVEDFAGTSDEDRAQAQAIVDSIQISLPPRTGPALTDGHYVAGVVQAVDLVRFIDSVAMSDADKADLIDNVLGIRDATTLQVVLDVEGDTMVASVIRDGQPAGVVRVWRIATMGPDFVVFSKPDGTTQRFHVTRSAAGFELDETSPEVNGGEREVVLTRILYWWTPFTPLP